VAHAGQELGNLVDAVVGVDDVVASRQLNKACARDALGQVARASDSE